MICFRDHYAFIGGPRPWSPVGPMSHTPGQWMLCIAAHHELLRWLLVAARILSADEDGGLLHWQWPWRPAIFWRLGLASVLAEVFEHPFCHVCLRPKDRLMLISTTSRDDEDLKPFDLCRNPRCPEGPTIIRSLST